MINIQFSNLCIVEFIWDLVLDIWFFNFCRRLLIVLTSPLITTHYIKFSSGIAGKLLFVSIGEQKLRDSGAKRRGVLEPVSKRERRFENTLEEASFLLLFFTHIPNIKLFGVRESTIWRSKKKEKNKDDSYYCSINHSLLTPSLLNKK